MFTLATISCTDEVQIVILVGFVVIISWAFFTILLSVRILLFSRDPTHLAGFIKKALSRNICGTFLAFMLWLDITNTIC